MTVATQHSSHNSALGSQHSTDDSGIQVGDVKITAEGLDDFGEQLQGLSKIDTSPSMEFSSYMDMLFWLDTDSTPLPNQLHTPLHSSLLAVGDCGPEGGSLGVGVSGNDVGVLGQDVDSRGASIDDTMESGDHPPSPETQVHTHT